MKENIKYKKLREIRKKKGYSAKYMAIELTKRQQQIAESTYYKKEIGYIPITVDEAQEIVNILKCSPLIFFK
jgi:transcriptional regulator with XRE-family HTH domain